jgi:hypothetical protein
MMNFKIEYTVQLSLIDGLYMIAINTFISYLRFRLINILLKYIKVIISNENNSYNLPEYTYKLHL